MFENFRHSSLIVSLVFSSKFEEDKDRFNLHFSFTLSQTDRYQELLKLSGSTLKVEVKPELSEGSSTVISASEAAKFACQVAKGMVMVS